MNRILVMLLCLLPFATAQGSDRVVSIDGSITEIVFALDQGHRLVGVDTTSRYPARAQELPDVGYMRQLSAEGILSLNPGMVITTEKAGPAQVLEQLSRAGLSIHTIHNNSNVDGVFEKIRNVAQLLDVPEKGEALVNQLAANVTDLKQQLKNKSADTPPRVMFLLAAGGHGVLLAGKDTQADAMIRLMGGVNVVDNFNSYKPLTPEAGLQTRPDIIVIAGGSTGTDILEEYKLLQHTPAALNQRIVSADSMLLLGFGPRIDQAIATLAPAFYVSN